MRSRVLIVGTFAGLVAAATAQDITIDSISRNGSLSFSGAEVGTAARIEWAASLTEPGRTNWHVLTNIVVTSESMTNDIPMFFRVRGTPATNPPSSELDGWWWGTQGSSGGTNGLFWRTVVRDSNLCWNGVAYCSVSNDSFEIENPGYGYIRGTVDGDALTGGFDDLADVRRNTFTAARVLDIGTGSVVGTVGGDGINTNCAGVGILDQKDDGPDLYDIGFILVDWGFQFELEFDSTDQVTVGTHAVGPGFPAAATLVIDGDELLGSKTDATGGSVTFTQTGSVLAGSYSLSFPGGDFLSGEFSVPTYTVEDFEF